MLTHHLASSPIWHPTYKSDTSVGDNLELVETNATMIEDFEGPGVPGRDNEVFFFPLQR